MGQRHARRNRRPRFQKPDTINIILGSLTIILLFVWGGLYWKESTQQALVVNADGAALNEQAQLEEIEVIANDPESTIPAGEAVPSATEEAVKPAEQPAEKPVASVEADPLPEKEEAVKPAVPVKTAKPVQTTKPARTAKPNQETVTKPVATPKPETPVVTVTEPPISVSEKYGQQITQLQAKCTADMNEVLVGAEASIEQLDMSDPNAFQQLNQKWMDGLANVETACHSKFQEIIVNAENDSVEPAITEEWNQTFTTLMMQLQKDFEAKVLQLMGG